MAVEIADLDAIAGNRAQALAGLEGRRPGLVERGDVDEIVGLDTQIRRGRIEGEVAAARRQKLVNEHDTLAAAEEHRADQAARRTAYVAARDAAKEAHRLYREEYPRLAHELAALLTRAAEIRTLVEAANDRLPEGEAPIPVDFEPSRGRAAIPAVAKKIKRHVYVDKKGNVSVLAPTERREDWKKEIRTEEVMTDAVREIAHVPLGDLVSLPGLRFGDAPYWTPNPSAFVRPAVPKENWANFIKDPPSSSSAPAPAQPARAGR